MRSQQRRRVGPELEQAAVSETVKRPRKITSYKQGDQTIGLRLNVKDPDGRSARILKALMILQLGRPLPPQFFSRRDFHELAQCPTAQQQRVIELLQPHNYQRLSDAVIALVAAVIHVMCLWATVYHCSPDLRPSRRNRKVRESTWRDASPPKQELRRVAKVAATAVDPVALAEAVVRLSPRAFDLLLVGAEAVAMPINWPPHLLDRLRIRRAAEAALRKKALGGRPRMFAHDRAVATIVNMYRGISGQSKVGRSTDWIGSQRPTGALHRLCLEIGNVYGLALVTERSDDRLRTLVREN
jgi:hypothetical protein